MVAWDQAKGKQSSGSNQRREIQRLTLGVGDTKVRLVGDVMPRYCYWVVTKEGKKMPVECLQFSRETESFDNSAQDPFKEIDEAIYSDKPQFSYVCNVIDRSDGQIKLFDLRSTIYSQIVDYATNPDYGNPADIGNGYDITIKKEKTGPLPQNVKYSIIPARGNSPLSDTEKELELFELSKIYKRQTYDEQKEWLLQNTSYFAGDVSDEFKPVEDVDDLALMKKSLADMKKPSATEEAPKERSFGAFKTVEGNQATIDLEKLRENNIFFATPCYGGMLTDQYFYLCLEHPRH